MPSGARAPEPDVPVGEEQPTQREIRAVRREELAALAQDKVPGAEEREKVPDWSLAQARTALEGATKDRDSIIDVALRYGRRTFDFAAAFAVVRGAAVGWDARGEN